MKKKLTIVLAAVLAVIAVLLALTLAIYRVSAPQAAERAAAQYGAVLDEATTKGSILLLMQQGEEENIVIYERSWLLPRYRLREVIPFSGQQGNFGHADHFQRFSFAVSDGAITVYPESVTSFWQELFGVSYAALPF